MQGRRKMPLHRRAWRDEGTMMENRGHPRCRSNLAAAIAAFILSAMLEETSSTVTCVNGQRASPGEQCLDRRSWPGNEVSSEQAGQTRSTAVFALYGAQNRDLGCAWPMQKQNIVDVLVQMGYDVDIFVLEMGNDTVLDGVPFKAGSRRSIADIYEFVSVQDVDRSLSTFCNISAACLDRGYELQDCKCTYKKELYKEIFAGTIQFAWRQLWQESAVADFLRSSSYDLAVAMESSIYPPTPIATTDIARIQKGLVLRTANNDAGGYTNGLYVGKPQDMASIMSRLTPMYLSEAHDYEHQLKRAFDQHNLASEILEGYTTPFKAFNKLRHTGKFWGWAEIDFPTKKCLEHERPEYGGGMRGGIRGGPLHPEDVPVAIAFRTPTCTGGQATNVSLSTVGLVDEVAYQIILTVSRHSDKVLLFTGDLNRVDDLLWESTIPPIPDGAYELQVHILQFCPGIPLEDSVLSHVTRTMHCVSSLHAPSSQHDTDGQERGEVGEIPVPELRGDTHPSLPLSQDCTAAVKLIQEQHLIVDWENSVGEDKMTLHIEENRLQLRNVLVHPVLSDKIGTMFRFYGQHVDDKRGSKPFSIYFVLDTAPSYQKRLTNRGERQVNTKLFDLKTLLRSRGFSIHATDNIQETKDNLAALGLQNEYQQRTFDSIRDVIDALNIVVTASTCWHPLVSVSHLPVALKYVVLRNFEGIPDHVTLDGHLDVDLLVSDYFLAKAVLDGTSKPDAQPFFEDGGYRVVNMVRVRGLLVDFDVRFVGDGYYDQQWERSILERAVMLNNCLVPDPQSHVYSLLYHALVHKRTIASDYAEVFLRNGLVATDETHGREERIRALIQYMSRNGFEFIRPIDRSVGFYLNADHFLNSVHFHEYLTEHSHVQMDEAEAQGRPCALLFFARARHFKDVVLPSIRENILAFNPSCDIYAHTWNLTSDSSRIGEVGVEREECQIHSEDVTMLTTNVMFETLASCQTANSEWQTESMESIMEEWHSINRVWGRMVESGKTYDRVGLFRLDTRFPHPIPIDDQRRGVVCDRSMAMGGFCDRMFYGDFDVARSWATRRFQNARKFVSAQGKPGLHPEKFVKFLLRDFEVEEGSVCVHHVVPCGNGTWTDDCKVNTALWDTQKKLDFFASKLASIAAIVRIGKESWSHNRVDETRFVEELVVRALADSDGWRLAFTPAAIDQRKLSVMDVSGHGGSKTYKVSAGALAVSLKLVGENGNQHYMPRVSVVSAIMHRNGLTPRVLAHNRTWMITQWQQGRRLDEDEPESGLREIGSLLAKVHSIHTSWFDEFRAQLLEEHPQLEGVDQGSHAWIYYARGITFTKKETPIQNTSFFLQTDEAELVQAWADCGSWCPQHPVAKRIVTAHGDFHFGNIVRADDGCLRLLDFDFACVTHAISDIAAVTARCLTPECKRAVLTGYLEQMQEPVDASMETLLVDCELAQLGGWLHGSQLAAWDIHDLPKQDVMKLVRACEQFAAQVRESETLQEQLTSQMVYISKLG